MDEPVHYFVAEKTNWRTLAAWIPAVLVPMGLLLAGYVVFVAAG